MLQTIHEKLQGPFAVTILGILAVVFVFWGVEFVSIGGGARATGLEVNGEDVNATELRREYQEQISRYQAALGAQEMPENLRQQLQQEVLERAVRSELISQRADKQRFRASDEQLRKSLEQIPPFQVDGKFDKDAYYATLRAQNIEPVAFEAQQRRDLAIRLLERGLTASAFATRSEIDRNVQLRREQRTVAYAVVPVGRFIAAAAPDEAALAAYYEKNGRQFLTAESATIEYVDLSIADVAAGVKVTEEALRGFYEDNPERFAPVERRRASHILISVDKDEAAAQKTAQDVYERARKGEDFAALAKQYSQDAGSAAQGGDLGWSEKSMFVGPFADAVWAMQPGEIRGPVRTEFGWHIIRLDGIEGGQSRSFEAARAEIEPEFRRNEAEKLFGDLQERLDTETFESGGNLQQVAAQLGLPLRRVENFMRSGGGDLGTDPRLVNTVFDAEMTSGSAARTVELGEGRVVAVRVVAYRKPEQRPLADVRAEVLAAVRKEQGQERTAAAARDLMQQLQAGGDWATLTAPYVAETAPGPSTTARAIGREDATMPVEVTQLAFKAPRPTRGPGFGVATLPNGDAAVWMVVAAAPGSTAGMSESERGQLVLRVLQELRSNDVGLYMAQLRSTARVKSNASLFE